MQSLKTICFFAFWIDILLLQINPQGRTTIHQPALLDAIFVLYLLVQIMGYKLFLRKVARNRVFNHIMFWLTLMLFFTISPLGYEIGFQKAFLMQLVYSPFSILLIYGVLYIGIPKLLIRKRYFLFFLYLGATYIADFGGFLLVKFHIAPVAGIPTDNDPLISDFFWSIITFTFNGGIAVAIKLIRYYYRLKDQQVEMVKQNMESEMNLLRSKINPHFLFNVLNNIDEMMYADVDKASKYIYLLSEIMRYMLTDADKEVSFLKDELNYVRNFVELTSNSLPKPDFIRMKVSGVVKQQKVPSLIFIPIIENAVKHSRKHKDDHIDIRFAIDPDHVSLESSNAMRYTKTGQPAGNNGFGLINLRKRLDLIYDKDYALTIDQHNNTYSSHLKIHFL